jgi:glycerophosphoryl diester phosphodiesterase
VIAHRGASGYLPEHTLAAYELAIRMGADYIEPDLQFTRDGKLVAMHDDTLDRTTDVKDKFQPRGRKGGTCPSRQTDAGDYPVCDFDLAEIQTLTVLPMGTEKTSYPGFTPIDGSFRIPTFDEVIEFAKEQSVKTGRGIGIYPEAKLADPEMEDVILATLAAHEMNKPDSRVFIQSFSEETIRSLHDKQQAQGTKVPLILLGVAKGAKMGVWRDLIGWADDSIEALDFSEVKKIADGVGVGLGSSYYTEGYPITREFIEQAHAAGLRVHGWTFEQVDAIKAQEEYREYLDMGMDGMFSNYPDLAILARDEPKAENHQFTTAGPIVISHRGASGYLPEHTLAAYELAIQMGVDYIEPDLQTTSDGVLVAMHDDTLDQNTNVEDVFEKRNGHNDYPVSDFTLAEIRQLKVDYSDAGAAKTSYPGYTPSDSSYNEFRIPTFDEVIEFAQAQSAKHGRPIGIYPEAKQADPLMEDRILDALAARQVNTAVNPVFIQSFYGKTIKNLHEKQYHRDLDYPLIQLGYGVMENGVAKVFVLEAPDGTSMAVVDLPTFTAYANGLGISIDPPPAGYLPAGIAPTAPTKEFIDHAHTAGLKVHGWTFNKAHAIDAAEEYYKFLEAGIDGYFSNYPNLGVLARDRFLQK